jgi:hypothetical protein
LSALVGLGLTLSAGLLLVLDITVGRVAAVALAAVFVVGIGLLWWALPCWVQRQQQRGPVPRSPGQGDFRRAQIRHLTSRGATRASYTSATAAMRPAAMASTNTR